ncbi:unnamed protein product [Absidia cylindrospora]
MTPTNDQQQHLDLDKRTMASKKMQMTLAFKCDTLHPSCTRCSQANASCSYEGSSSQVDIYNIIKLNETVSTLQQRIQYLEWTISDIQYTKSTANDVLGKDSTTTSLLTTTVSPDHASSSLSHGQHQWALSLTSTGLQIDTDIVSLPNLYNILLSGVSQLDLNQQCTTTSGDGLSSVENPTLSSLCHYSETGHRQQQKRGQHSGTDLLTDKPIMVQPKTPLWRSKLTTFPLYSTWSSDSLPKASRVHSSYSSTPMDRFHLQHKRSQQYRHGTAPVPPTSVLGSMIDIYSECFLCLPDTGYGGTISERYHQGTLDPMLANAIFAWSARHGAIYHNLYIGQDPNQVGECYFNVAKDLLKERFTTPTIDTLHGVLILYIYAIGRPSTIKEERQSTTAASEAYIFLGLAIRMCLELKLHKENMDDDDQAMMTVDDDQSTKMECYRRFFWVLYFLETLCALHSDRPFSLPSEDQITVTYPNILDNETGERRWRAEFMMKRFRITRIYRDIIQRTSQPTLLPLSCISELDASLGEWYDQLPPYLKYQQGDLQRRKWKSTSFREQACIKLNFEYHFQRCQLYGVFLKRKQDDRVDEDDDRFDGHGGGMDYQHENNKTDHLTEASMEATAKKVCVTSATMTVELMQCWNQLQQRWCHFSLEALMMAVNIFEMQLKDDTHVEQTKAHLTTLLDILQASPIQHHRHVIIVTTRIQELLYMKCNDDSDIGWTLRAEMATAATTVGNNSEIQEQQHISHQQLETPTSTTLQQSMEFYNAWFPPQHSNGMFGAHHCDHLPFSDFLYNPVMQQPSSSSFESYTITAQTPWTTTQPPPPLSLNQTYSPTLASSSSSSSTPLSSIYSTFPLGDDSAASLWTTTTATTTLHQPTYASNGSAIFESFPLQQGHPSFNQQPDPANEHHLLQQSIPYSANQR